MSGPEDRTALHLYLWRSQHGTADTAALRRGVELVVACPGRLLDHLLKGTLDLSNVEVLIIDEADRMFDMGFLPDIRNIVRCLTKPHQTLLFSATMPEDIRRWCRKYCMIR